MAPSVFSRRKRSQQAHHVSHPSQHLQPPSEANALLAAGLAFAASSNGHNPNPHLSSSAAAAALKSASQQPPNPSTVIGRIPTKRMLNRSASYSSSVGSASMGSNSEGVRARRAQGPIERSASSASSMSERRFRSNEGSRSRLAIIGGDGGSNFGIVTSRQGGSSSPAGSWNKGKQKSSEGSLDVAPGDFTLDQHIPAIPHEVYEREARNLQTENNHHHDHMHHHHQHHHQHHQHRNKSNYQQRGMNRQDHKPQLSTTQQSIAGVNQSQRLPSLLNKSTCSTCECSCHDSPPPSLIYHDEDEEQDYDNSSIGSLNRQLRTSQPIENKNSRHHSYDYPHNDGLVDQAAISPRSTAPPPLRRPSAGVRRYSAPPTTSNSINPTVTSPTSPNEQSQNFFRLLRTDVNSSAPPSANPSASATKRFPSMKLTKIQGENKKNASVTKFEQLPTPSASPPDSFRSSRVRKGKSMHRDENLSGKMIITPAVELSPPQSISSPGSTHRRRRKVSDNSTATNSTLSNIHIPDIIEREEAISPSPSSGGRRRRRRRGGRGGGATEPPPVPPIPYMMSSTLRSAQPNAPFKSSNNKVAQEGDLLAKGTLREETVTPSRHTKGPERVFEGASIVGGEEETPALKAARDAAGRRRKDDKLLSPIEREGAIEKRKSYGVKRQGGRKMWVELESEDRTTTTPSRKAGHTDLRTLDDDNGDDYDDDDGINEMIESQIATDSSDPDDVGIKQGQVYNRRKSGYRRDNGKSTNVQEPDIVHKLQFMRIPEEHEKEGKKGKEGRVNTIKAQHKRINSARHNLASSETIGSSSDELDELVDSINPKRIQKIQKTSKTLPQCDAETSSKSDLEMSQAPELTELEERSQQQSLPSLILQPSTPQSFQEPFPDQTKQHVDNNPPTPFSLTASNANSDPNPLEKKHLLRVLSNPEIPTVMHDPPPRSVSPGKSAMKKAPSLKQGTGRREGKGQVVQFSDTASEIEIDCESPPSPWGIVTSEVEQGEKKEKEKKASGFSSWFRWDKGKGKDKDKEKKSIKKGKLSRKKGGEVPVMETAVKGQGRDVLPPSSASSENEDVDEALRDDSITLKKLSPVQEMKEESELGEDVLSPSSSGSSSDSETANANHTLNSDTNTLRIPNPEPKEYKEAEIASELITTSITGHIPGEWVGTPTTQQALSSTNNTGGYFAGVGIPLGTAAATLRPPSTFDIQDNSDKGSISGTSIYEDAPEELPSTSPPNSPPPIALPVPHATQNRTKPQSRLDKTKETQLSSPKSPSQQSNFPKSLRSSTPVSSSTTITSQSTKRRERSRSPSPSPALPAASYALPPAAITPRTQALIDEHRRQIELGKGGLRKKPATPSNNRTESESETEVEMENNSHQQRANGKRRGTSGVSPAVRAAMLSSTTSKATVIAAKGNGHAHLHKAKKNTSTGDPQQRQSGGMMSRASFRSSASSQPATPTSPSKPSTFLGFRTGSLTMAKDKEDKDKHLRLRNLPARQPNRFTSRFSHDSSDDDTGDNTFLGWGAFQSHISAAESSSSSDDEEEVEAAKKEREREVERLVALLSKNQKVESDGEVVQPSQVVLPGGTGSGEGTITSNGKATQDDHDSQREDGSEEEEIFTLNGTVGGEKDKKKNKKKAEKEKKQKGKEKKKGWGGIFGGGSADKKIDHVPLPKMRAADISNREKEEKSKRAGAASGIGDTGISTSTNTTKTKEKESTNTSVSTSGSGNGNGHGSKLKRIFGIGR